MILISPIVIDGLKSLHKKGFIDEGFPLKSSGMAPASVLTLYLT